MSLVHRASCTSCRVAVSEGRGDVAWRLLSALSRCGRETNLLARKCPRSQQGLWDGISTCVRRCTCMQNQRAEAALSR